MLIWLLWTSRVSCSVRGYVAILHMRGRSTKANVGAKVCMNFENRSTFMLEPSRPVRRTHMLEEIQEQPEALRRTITRTIDPVRQVALEAQQRGVDVIILAARGTSDHAAIYAQYLFQYLNGIPVALATPSLYTLYGTSLRLEKALVIGISQSGESPDIVEVVARARQAGALTVGITNQDGSPLATTAQYTLLCHA